MIGPGNYDRQGCGVCQGIGMDKTHSNRMWLRTSGLIGVAGLALAGCDSLEAVTGSAAAPSAAAVSIERGALRIEERDVEAPDVFALRDRGLWDGRPSLGGIWVAVPQSVEPDRVRITNTESGQTVVGGLFRKEVDTPGPAILVSADAAAALGMQAGTPARLELVVLRRETIEIAPPPPVVPIEEAVTETEDDAEAEAEEVVAAETDAAAETATPAAEAVAAATTAAIAATALPPADASEPAEPDVAAAPAPEAPAPALARPYIQVATLGTPVEANAVVKKLQSGGLSAELRVLTLDEKTSFSVVIGPAKSEEERSEIMKRVRDLGYDDAFEV